jgi:hypothetical protein
MSYVVAQPHKCTKCGHEEELGGSMMDHWTKTPITDENDAVCPKCWNDFLKNFGKMKCTIDWRGHGSAYDIAKQNEN